MPRPHTTCEHCGTAFKLPIKAPQAAIVGSQFTCPNCSKLTTVTAVLLPNPAAEHQGMPLPVKCTTCGSAFTVDIKKSMDAVDKGQSQPIFPQKCVRCGGEAFAEFGKYAYGDDGGLQFTPMKVALSDADLPLDDMRPSEVRELLAFFSEALKNPVARAKELAAAVEKSPALQKLAKLTIPETAGDTYTLIGFLIMVIPLLRKWLKTVTRKAAAKAKREAHTLKARAAKTGNKIPKKAVKKRAKKPSPFKAPRKRWKEKKSTKLKPNPMR